MFLIVLRWNLLLERLHLFKECTVEQLLGEHLRDPPEATPERPGISLRGPQNTQ